MLQTSTDSINQFLQSKSTRNNFSHSIKYISASNLKEPYPNKSLLNKNNEIISPRIDLIDKVIFKNSKNKNHISNNYLKNIRHINQKNSSEKIINKSSDNFPRIILTKRGMKEITGKAPDSDRENNNNFYHYIKSEKKGEIRRAKSGYIEIPKNEKKSTSRYSSRRKAEKLNIQESFSFSPFFLNDYDMKESNSNSSRKIYVKNEYSTNMNKDYRKNNNSYNTRFNNYTNRNVNDVNYKSNINDNIVNDRVSTLENVRKSSHYSLDNINDQKYQNKENHKFVSITNKKILKDEIRRDYRRANSILVRQNDFNLNPSNSNKFFNTTIKYIRNSDKENNNKSENIRILRNKNNHVLYESKNLKTEKPKQKIITVNLIDKNENNIIENKNNNNTQNFRKITKISKIQEKNNNENDKKEDNTDNKMLNKINKKRSISNKELNSVKDKINENKLNNKENIINNNSNNDIISKNQTNNIKNNNVTK